MKKITTSAPGKLLLFGDHAVVYGHPCIVTAIDQRMYVTVELRDDENCVINAPDLSLSNYQQTLSALLMSESFPKPVRFLCATLRRFLQTHPQTRGVTITSKTAFSHEYGFGSSSAISVALAKALFLLYGLADISSHELFSMVYQAVLDVQKAGSGFDLAAAIWGGTIFYISPAKVVEQISVPNIPLVVGYTGIKVDTPTLIKQVAVQQAQDPARTASIFSRSSAIVGEARVALEAGDWRAVGQFMNQNQVVLAELGVSSPILYRLIEAAKNAGATGAKLSGAGKGDCMIAIAEDECKNRVETAIVNAGGKPLSVRTNAVGVRIEEENA